MNTPISQSIGVTAGAQPPPLAAKSRLDVPTLINAWDVFLRGRRFEIWKDLDLVYVHNTPDEQWMRLVLPKGSQFKLVPLPSCEVSLTAGNFAKSAAQTALGVLGKMDFAVSVPNDCNDAWFYLPRGGFPLTLVQSPDTVPALAGAAYSAGFEDALLGDRSVQYLSPQLTAANPTAARGDIWQRLMTERVRDQLTMGPCSRISAANTSTHAGAGGNSITTAKAPGVLNPEDVYYCSFSLALDWAYSELIAVGFALLDDAFGDVVSVDDPTAVFFTGFFTPPLQLTLGAMGLAKPARAISGTVAMQSPGIIVPAGAHWRAAVALLNTGAGVTATVRARTGFPLHSYAERVPAKASS